MLTESVGGGVQRVPAVSDFMILACRKFESVELFGCESRNSYGRNPRPDTGWVKERREK